MFARFSITLLSTLAGAALASAQTVDVEVHSERKIVAAHAEDPSAAGTTIDIRDRVTIPRSLGDVLLEAPGAQVTRTGGMGAFSSVALRGAAGEETLVLLDEIPLTTADGGAFDLSLFPAELFDRVTVFRGGAPVWLGSGAIGGVLQLTPRRREQNGLNVSLGAGSYDTYQVQAGAEVTTPRGWQSHSQLVVRGTEGDFPYRDDRGTRFDATDDITLRRKNADFLEASGFQDLRIPVGRGMLHVLALGLQRGGGFPGPGSQPTPSIRREATKAITAVAYEREAGDRDHFKRRLQVVGSGAYGAERFKDLYGQLGTSKQTDTEDHMFRAFLRAAGSLYVTRWLETTLVSTYSIDAYLPRNAYAYPQPETSRRHSAGNSLELAFKGELGPARFELRPSARLDWTRTKLHARTGYRGDYDPDKTILAPTARCGAVIELWSFVALSGSVATGVRVPTMFELFGDGGLVLPSFQLKPVSSTTYDGGVTAKGRAGLLRGRAELRGFAQQRRDSIALYRTAQFQVGNENLPSVKQWGVESNVSGALGEHFSVNGSFTWLDTKTALGARLPLRPRFTAYVRPEAKIRFTNDWFSGASVAGELAYRSFAYLDNANLAYTDACAKVAVGAATTLFKERIRVSARMDDTANARCFDLLGFPLMGRSLLFSVTYQEVTNEDT